MSDSGNAAQPELSTRLVTTPMLDADPPSFRVSWISWDSGFRGSGLQVGDQIVAVNGKSVVRPDDQPERQRLTQSFIGQYEETQTWTAANTRPSDPVTLSLRRKNAGAGWISAQATGQLKPLSSAFNDNGEPLLAAGGPVAMTSDTFSETWDSWYQAQISKWSAILDGGWRLGSFNNRLELAAHLERKARVDYLATHYPGSFAESVLADWQTVHECLEGPRIELAPDAIKFRVAEEERVAQATAIAQKAWADFVAKLAPQTLSAFPAPNPIRDDHTSAAGKYIVLPAIRKTDWLSQGGKTFFASGSESDGWYFADAETPSSIAMLLAVERYQRLVTPSIDESFQIVARILPDVDLRVVSGVGYYGMPIEIAAALVGNSMFVDVTARRDTHAPFAGEDIFDMPMHTLPPPDASPSDVMNSFFGALKTGDAKLWSALFANWTIEFLEDGRPVLAPFSDQPDPQRWDDSRRVMLSNIYDLRVSWVDDPRLLTTGAEFTGAPRIEEVEVEIDHVGCFDGEYRIFKSVTVERIWKLQRTNGGPWRISTVQNI